MPTTTYYDCTSIVEKKDIDDNIVAYCVTKDGVTVEYPCCKVNSRSGITARDAVGSIQKSGATVTSIQVEAFCEDENDKEYFVFTTDSES